MDAVFIPGMFNKIYENIELSANRLLGASEIASLLEWK